MTRVQGWLIVVGILAIVVLLVVPQMGAVGDVIDPPVWRCGFRYDSDPTYGLSRAKAAAWLREMEVQQVAASCQNKANEPLVLD